MLTDSIRSMLSSLRCMDFRSEFIDETLFLTVDILAAYCMINGSDASSNSLSSSAKFYNKFKLGKKYIHKETTRTLHYTSLRYQSGKHLRVMEYSKIKDMDYFHIWQIHFWTTGDYWEDQVAICIDQLNVRFGRHGKI